MSGTFATHVRSKRLVSDPFVDGASNGETIFRTVDGGFQMSARRYRADRLMPRVPNLSGREYVHLQVAVRPPRAGSAGLLWPQAALALVEIVRAGLSLGRFGIQPLALSAMEVLDAEIILSRLEEEARAADV